VGWARGGVHAFPARQTQASSLVGHDFGPERPGSGSGRLGDLSYARPGAHWAADVIGRKRSMKQLRRACEARLRELPFPHPFSVRALCELVAAQRGRPVRLKPVTGNHGVWGLWVATDSADLIFYEQATTWPHQEHIILHELSHLLCDHYPAPLSVAEHTRLLLPDLDPEMVRRVLGRTTYSAVEEQEAELLASLIWRRARSDLRAPHPGADDGGSSGDPGDRSGGAQPAGDGSGAVERGTGLVRDDMDDDISTSVSDRMLHRRLQAALDWHTPDPPG
jgi:hypothetical protein